MITTNDGLTTQTATITRTIKFRAIEFKTARAALAAATQRGYSAQAITLNGKPYVVGRLQAQSMERQGVPFAYLGEAYDARGTRRIVTIPVND